MAKAEHKLSSRSSILFKYIEYVLFFLAMLPAVIYIYRQPHYNWDMLPYMAIVSGINENNADSVHKIVYSDIQKDLPPDIVGQLTQGGEYRKRMATDQDAFYKQLPFYNIKPFYTGLCYLFYHCGFPLTKSTLLPSILSFLLIGLLVFHWLRKYYRFIFAFIVTLLLMYSGYMISVTSGSIPDGLSGFFLLCSFYFILEKPSLLFLFLFLLISVFIRIDNAFNAFFILSLLTFSGRWIKRISTRNYFVMTSLIAVAFLLISANSTSQGWSILYYPTFTHYYNSSYSFNEVFSVRDYFALLYSKLIAGILFSHLSFFVLLAFLVFCNSVRSSIRKMTFPQWFCILLLSLITVRFLLFPDLSDRFYIAYYFVITILFIKKVIPKQNKTDTIHAM